MAAEFAISSPRKVFVYREKTEQTYRLQKSLSLAQGSFAKVVKNKVGQYGPFADLASMRDATVPALAANGLCVTQEYAMQGGEIVLVTTLGHESGEWVSSVLPVKQAASPQQTMGYMTYMRRAAYAAILCLAAEEEDDGRTAESAAASSISESSQSLEQRAAAVIQTAQSQEALDTILRKVEQQIASGKMAKDSLDRLRVLAVKVLTRLTEGQK
jgi:hypothetical protein